jgi:hypothetical protein
MSKYSTQMQWGNGRWIVMLYRDAQLVAAMSIEDWAALGATKHAMEYRPVKQRRRPVPKWLAAGKMAGPARPGVGWLAVAQDTD